MPSAPAVCATALLIALGASPCGALQVTGLEQPQSFVADPSGAGYFISNVSGDPASGSSRGFITKLDASGSITKFRFIDGGASGPALRAPKGMAVVGETLYVADLDAVRAFHTKTGQSIATISIGPAAGADGKAVALADVAYDGHGLLYASHPDGNAIYRIDTQRQHAVSLLVRDKTLAGPYGLAVHPQTGRLIAVSRDKGKIIEITPDGAITELVSNSFFSARFSSLSGVDFDSMGNMYVSDMTAGKIWRVAPNRRFDVIAEYLPTPALIGIDREKHLILVPYLYGDAAEINGLESPIKSGKQKRTLKDYGFEGMKPVPKPEDK
jgi:hypothetical protein